MHIMKAVSHGIDGINDEPHLTVLDIVVLKAFITCKNQQTKQQLLEYHCDNLSVLVNMKQHLQPNLLPYLNSYLTTG